MSNYFLEEFKKLSRPIDNLYDAYKAGREFQCEKCATARKKLGDEYLKTLNLIENENAELKTKLEMAKDCLESFSNSSRPGGFNEAQECLDKLK